MVRYYCDICGRESNGKKYIIPVYKTLDLPRIYGRYIRPEEADICILCAKAICNFIGILKKYDGSVEDTIQLLKAEPSLVNEMGDDL